MDRTLEQVAADNNLTEALERVAHAYESVEDDEMLVTFLTVGFASSFKLVESGETRMVIIYKDGEMPVQEAAGLLSLGYDRLAQEALGIADEEYVWSMEEPPEDDDEE